MKSDHEGFEVQPYGRTRQLVRDAGWLARRKQMIHGFVEADVTLPRRLMRDYRCRTGESLSFTAFVLACLGRAVEENRVVHAYRDWHNRLILFDEVDVLIMVEIDVKGGKFPQPHIVRAANRRTVSEIHSEIRGILAAPTSTEGAAFIKFFPLLPTPVRHLLYRAMEWNPRWRKRYVGTVAFTSVGMFGVRGGWGLGAPSHSVSVILGGITEKPGVVSGNIEVREYLPLTIGFDHDIVDGAPAARFTQRLLELIESGYGLDRQLD